MVNHAPSFEMQGMFGSTWEAAPHGSGMARDWCAFTKRR